MAEGRGDADKCTITKPCRESETVELAGAQILGLCMEAPGNPMVDPAHVSLIRNQKVVKPEEIRGALLLSSIRFVEESNNKPHLMKKDSFWEDLNDYADALDVEANGMEPPSEWSESEISPRFAAVRHYRDRSMSPGLAPLSECEPLRSLSRTLSGSLTIT